MSQLNAVTQTIRSYTHYIYDIECYMNFFSFRATRETDGAKWCFEISEWVNQGRELNMFLHQVAQSGGRMVGFRNCYYDYPMIHLIMEYQGNITNGILYNKSQAIIADQKINQFAHTIRDWEVKIPQLDLCKIHHFDNKAKMTSLKLLEFNMRMDNVEELPYDWRYPVTYEQSRHLLEYNDHDVTATLMFFERSKPMIDFRDQLSAKHGKDFTNHNDTKIGADYFVMELKKHGINANKNNQSIRHHVNIGEIILPHIKFDTPEFNNVLEFFRGITIPVAEIKGFFEKYEECVVDFGYIHLQFGAGGLHGSLHKTIVHSDDEYEVIDSDVASYYPNVPIANRFFPEHLSEKFCDVYLDVYNQRKSYKKGTPENAMLKLALNGVYGKSNDKHSPFLDPKYTLQVTINGQLMLAMLAEQLMKIPGLMMIQFNTDGITYKCPKQYVDHAMKVSAWWEDYTKLELEHAHYERMCIRDVNNYLAVTDSGKIKRIGAYAHESAEVNPGTRELPWNKNHGGIVIAKAAEAALVRGENIEAFIRNHINVDPMDFMFRTKVPKSASLVGVRDLGWGMDQELPLSNITRYYVSNSGVELVKIMEPTESGINNWRTQPHWRHKKTGEHKCAKKAPSGMWEQISMPSMNPPDRRIGIEAGWKVIECNRMTDSARNLSDVNIDYYVTEARKLVDELLT